MREAMVLETARKRKGQKPVNKPSRLTLMGKFAGKEYHVPGFQHTLTNWMPSPYPPSTTRLTDLQPIRIAELRLETHHTGKVLIVRTFGHPQKTIAVQIAVEDVLGDVDRMSVYNYPLASTKDTLLPSQIVVAIKEPYYETAPDGEYSIRVDHPSNLIELSHTHESFPHTFKTQQHQIQEPAATIKDLGNQAHKDGDHIMAIKYYTSGLAKSDDAVLRCDLLRNRAYMNHLLKRYKAASADALGAVLPEEATIDDVKRGELNAKSLFRAGRAQFALMDFSAAKVNFERATKLAPKEKEYLRELEKTESRLKEKESDRFDLATILKSLSLKNRLLDHASYLSGVDVREAGKRGKGLFATRNFAAGDLVFAEKALNVATAAEGITSDTILVYKESRQSQSGGQISLLWKMIDQLSHDPEQAREVFQLSAGGYSPACKAETIDGATAIDCFHLLAIIRYNAFGLPDLRTGEGFEDAESSAGLWIKASRINHACIGNTHRSFHGDFMLVHAVRNIAKDEEITMPYAQVMARYHDSMARIQHVWGFRCDCEMCNIEKSINADLRKARTKLLTQASDLLLKQRKMLGADSATIRRMKDLYRDLVATYPQTVYHARPRIEIADISIWLCFSASQQETFVHGKEHSFEILRNLGFQITIDGDELTIDRSYAHCSRFAINAAACAAHVLKTEGKIALSQKFVDFARSMYRIMHGDLCNSQLRYGI